MTPVGHGNMVLSKEVHRICLLVGFVFSQTRLHVFAQIEIGLDWCLLFLIDGLVRSQPGLVRTSNIFWLDVIKSCTF